MCPRQCLGAGGKALFKRMVRWHHHCQPPFLGPACWTGAGFSHNPLAFPSKLSCTFLLPHVPGMVASSPFCRSSAPAATLLYHLHSAAGGERFRGTVPQLFPPLTTVSPLTHDWQQQAGGGRPAGHKPAPGLAWIHWKRPAEGLAEKSLTGGTAPFPLPK